MFLLIVDPSRVPYPRSVVNSTLYATTHYTTPTKTVRSTCPGFADSLNASVAAALCIHTLLDLYGPAACGDLAREAQPSELDQLRREWAEHLSRGPEQMQRMLDLLSSGALDTYDDLRRPDAYRAHCGKLKL